MISRNHRGLSYIATAAMMALCGGAAAAAGAPPDLDALSLADTVTDTPAKTARPWQLFVEGALGHQSVSAARGDANVRRLSFDLRLQHALGSNLSARLSNRLDLAHRDQKPDLDDVNTLREAYLTWTPTNQSSIDLGRVNIRHGVAVGYNPTDWFKVDAVRSAVSADPAVLRENRQGTVALQGQHVWDGGSIGLSFSPRLDRGLDDATFSLDAGRTNPRHRWLAVASMQVADGFSPQWHLHGGDGLPTQLGLNLSLLASDAAVIYMELSLGRGPSLLEEALGGRAARRFQRRVAAGATYTTPFNLTATAEAEFNSAAPDRGQWRGLNTGERLAILALADRQQELPSRRALFVHATWKDAFWARLDVSGFVRMEAHTHSRDQWLEARYRWDTTDLSLQWHAYSGGPTSFYGVIPQRRSIELALRHYF